MIDEADNESEISLNQGSAQNNSLRSSIIEVSNRDSLELPTCKEEREIDFEHMGVSPNKDKDEKSIKSRNNFVSLEEGDTGDSSTANFNQNAEEIRRVQSQTFKLNPQMQKMLKLECISEKASDHEDEKEHQVKDFDFLSSNKEELQSPKMRKKSGDVISGLSLRESEFYFIKPTFLQA